MSGSRLALTATFAAAVVLSAAACSGSQTPAENTASACDAYNEFSDAVSQARSSLSADSTIEEFQTERDNIASHYEDLDAALSDISADQRTAFEDAWNNFSQSVSSIDNSMTIPETFDSLSADLDQVRAARENLRSELSC